MQKERDGSIVANEYLMAAPGLYVGGDIARYNYHYSKASVSVCVCMCDAIELSWPFVLYER